MSTSTIWLVSAGSIFTHGVSFCIFPPSLITPRFRTVKGLFAIAHRPQQPPVCTAHRVAGPSRITHQDDLSSGWRHHVAPCAPISSLSYPRRSLVPCIAKQWKNTLSFLRCPRLKLERRGSRSKCYKWPLKSKKQHCALYHIHPYPTTSRPTSTVDVEFPISLAQPLLAKHHNQNHGMDLRSSWPRKIPVLLVHLHE